MARAKATALRLQNIEFRVGDMESLGFPDGAFDAVVCVFAMVELTRSTFLLSTRINKSCSKKANQEIRAVARELLVTYVIYAASLAPRA